MTAHDWRVELPIEVDPIYGCHLWTGDLTQNGYPRMRDGHGNERVSAHRTLWERARGSVPDDKVLDHLCRRRHCVNLDHIELVTKSQNELRKSWSYRCKRTRCAKGHDLATAIVTPEGGRLCRRCHLDARVT